MAERTAWHRTAERHFAADLGRIGSLLALADAGTGTWNILVLGVQRSGFRMVGEAHAAAMLLARELLDDAVHKLGELEASASQTA